VEVLSDRPLTLAKEDLEGLFMHSDVAPVGKIASGNGTIDKIWAATNHSYLSNLFGYPTDCPQREKNGWTGDAAIASETGLYNFDAITVYEKWLADHRDEQQPNGVLPSIIPTGGWGYEWGNGPDWTSTVAIIPWNLYLYYGDTTALARGYAAIRRYVEHIASLYPSGLCSWGLGDWIPVKTKTPVELTSTCYYYTDVMILARAAALLGFTDDHKRYAALAERIRAAFTAKYWHPAPAIYDSGSQTQLSVPLYWGIVPDSIRGRASAALAARVKADGGHLDVGLLGTKAILNALSENGYADVAWKLAAQEGYPSWGWWIVNGATTLYENWPIDAKSDISMNHIMFGEIGAWLYKGPGGIRPDPAAPGFRHVLLEPHFVAGLDHFEAEHEGPYGRIRSAWRRRGKRITYEVTVPANSSATVVLPGRRIEVGAGTWKWEIIER
jgi:alpha-L-rhamnosidase